MINLTTLAFDEKNFIDISVSHVCSTCMDPRFNTPDPVDSTFSRFSFFMFKPYF